MSLIETNKSNADVLLKALLMLSRTVPKLPSSILTAKASQILSAISQLLSSPETDTLKMTLVVLRAILSCLSLKAWTSSPDPHQVFSSILSLTFDSREDVRNAAIQSCQHILSRPPPPSLAHPASSTCLEMLYKLEASFSAAESGTACVPYLEALILILPAIVKNKLNEKAKKKLEQLALTLIKLPSKLLTHGGSFTAINLTFQALTPLVGAMREEGDDEDSHSMPVVSLNVLNPILEALFEMKPNENDVLLVSSWSKLVAQGII